MIEESAYKISVFSHLIQIKRFKVLDLSRMPATGRARPNVRLWVKNGPSHIEGDFRNPLESRPSVGRQGNANPAVAEMASSKTIGGGSDGPASAGRR